MTLSDTGKPRIGLHRPEDGQRRSQDTLSSPHLSTEATYSDPESSGGTPRFLHGLLDTRSSQPRRPELPASLLRRRTWRYLRKLPRLALKQMPSRSLSSLRMCT